MITHFTGHVLMTLQNTLMKPELRVEFTDVKVSALETLVYALQEDGKLICFDLESGRIEGELEVDNQEVLGIAKHPMDNCLCSWNDKGFTSLWKM